MEFQYNALDPRRSEIRLLNLQLAQDSVSCSIKHHYMDEDPLYVSPCHLLHRLWWRDLDAYRPRIYSIIQASSQIFVNAIPI